MDRANVKMGAINVQFTGFRKGAVKKALRERAPRANFRQIG